MTLLIVNVCAFANRTWHQAKFHYFHACFGFTGIKKLSFSMFPTQPRRPEFWISFPFLAWNLEIYPRTHMWFFNQLWCTGTCACISNLNYAHKGDTFPLRTTSLLERSSGLQETYTKTCSYSAIFLPQHGSTMTWHHAKFHDFQACFGFTRILKPSFSMFSAEPRCPNVWISFPFLAWDLEIHPRTHMWFSTNFDAREHVLVVQIWIMHIKWPKTQLMCK